jgi:hypothetical protein
MACRATLLPVRGNMESFTSIELGLLGTAYFLGFTFGCLHGPLLVRRFRVTSVRIWR